MEKSETVFLFQRPYDCRQKSRENSNSRKFSKVHYSFGNLGRLFVVLETAAKANTLNCRYNKIYIPAPCEHRHCCPRRTCLILSSVLFGILLYSNRMIIVFHQFANIKPLQFTRIVQGGTSGVVFDAPVGTAIQ